MDRRRIDPSILVLLALIAFYVYLLYSHALNARYIMDEFLLASWAGDLYRGLRPYVDFQPVKTQVGTLAFVVPFFLFDDTVGILLASRIIGFLIALISLGVVFLFQRRVFGHARSAVWAVFWTLTCSTFLERGFRIRVDMLATVWAMLAVYGFLVLKSWRRPLAAGMLLSLSFCTTQKAVLFIAAFTVAFWIVCRRSDFRPIRDFAIFGLAGIGVFAVYVIVWGFGGHYAEVIRTTFGPESTVTVAVESSYYALHRFFLQTFSRNPAFYSMSLLGLAYVIMRWRSNAWQIGFLGWFTLALLGCLLALPKPWPYVFVMIIPFLGSVGGHLLDRILEAAQGPHRVVLIALGVLVATVVVHSVERYKDHQSLTIAQQAPSIRAADATLGPGDTYFDGVRMIPTRTHATPDVLVKQTLDDRVKSWQTEGPRFLQALRDAECKLFIYNYRLTVFPDDFHRFIKDHYVMIERNVFVSGSDITTSPLVIDLVWPGIYGIYSQGRCENIAIDGRPVDAQTGEIHLEAGRHRVTYRGEGFFLLIPREARQYMEEHRFERRLDPLFARHYRL